MYYRIKTCSKSLSLSVQFIGNNFPLVIIVFPGFDFFVSITQTSAKWNLQSYINMSLIVRYSLSIYSRRSENDSHLCSFYIVTYSAFSDWLLPLILMHCEIFYDFSDWVLPLLLVNLKYSISSVTDSKGLWFLLTTKPSSTLNMG